MRVRGFTIEGARGTSSTNVYFQGSAHHIELSGNEIRYSQDQGIFSERTTSNLYLLRNRIHDNGRGHEPGQHQSHGIYLEGTDHYVANNAVHDHPYGFGIQIYPANSRSLIVNNTVVGSGQAGIVVGGDGGVSAITIRNNILAFNAELRRPDGQRLPRRARARRHERDLRQPQRLDRGRLRRGRCLSRQHPEASSARLRPVRRPSVASPAARRSTVHDPSRLRGTTSTASDRPIGAGTDIGAFERGR